ncbi:aminotransferase class V-fold PLP-dependent enzyme [Actinocrispum wychmicini]|uniref:cysteine desulfurase n=1 Tax=Actinocrispum wychmicini TaxID=1213861 RepID=A0A4R2JIC9_9PSEU|nr:cysteine desulfurase [Actinocrispum wychmicini]TCO59661.1 cysteine desulfurase/selenocysteine lyase [Actinocrispum wychmicini]
MVELVGTAPRNRASLGDSVRSDFPILSTTFSGNQLVYLDNAATSQKPRRVLDALVGYYHQANANIGRGYYQLSHRSTDSYDRARSVVQGALNAEHAEEIVFVPGTTAALNLLADTWGRAIVGAGDQVVVTGMEHNSNLLPWRRLCDAAAAELVVVPAGQDGRVRAEAFADAMGPRVRLAAVTHVSNVLGTVNPVSEMAAHAHRAGVPIVVDGAQAVPHRRVDVRELGADFYCFSGHKAYGPMGIGVLYGRRDLLHQLPPYQVGGGTVKGVSTTGPVQYVPAPARLEAGTPHVAGAVALAEAFGYLSDLGWEAIQAHDELLVRAAVDAIGRLPGARVLGDPAVEPSGIVSFVVDGIHPYDIGGHLDAHGIAVRCGVHCANTFVDTFGVVGTVRLSFGVYNTESEVDAVGRALRTVQPGSWTREHPNERFL